MSARKLEDLFHTPRLPDSNEISTESIQIGMPSSELKDELVPSISKLASSELKDELVLSISKLDATKLLHFLWDTCEAIPYKTKKELNKEIGLEKVPNTPDIINFLVLRMEGILTCKFLHIDRTLSLKSRDINDTSWNHVSAIQRSADGTVGIFMVQSKYIDNTSDIIVAKPYTQIEYSNQIFVNHMSTYFKISCPMIRSIERQSDEWKELKAAVDKFYIDPFHEGMYENGGRASPKPLFDSSLIMLMEYSQGKPLQHKINGQRRLLPSDYFAIGKLFLFDLLIRNTDRLPCRKTIPRTVAGGAIADQGNAGNIMLGEAGELSAIDNEMQLTLSVEQKEEYFHSFESVLTEILHRHHKMPHYRNICTLFFDPVAAMQGILDSSLERISPWKTDNDAQTMAISAVLQLIRVRARVDEKLFWKTPSPPPSSDEEKEWREWIRTYMPRTITDIMEFIEASTGYPCDEACYESFEDGFRESIETVYENRKEFIQSLTSEVIFKEGETNEIIAFILHLISDAVAPIYEQYKDRSKRAKQLWSFLSLTTKGAKVI